MRLPADGGHPRAKVGEQLDGAADRAGRTVGEHVLASAEASLADDGQGVVRTLGARSDVPEGQTGWHRRQRPVLGDRRCARVDTDSARPGGRVG